MKIPYLIPCLVFIVITILIMGIFISVDQGIIPEWWYIVGIVIGCFGIGLMWYYSIKMWSSKLKKSKEHKKHSKKN
mgnify:CR=1 FL=1